MLQKQRFFLVARVEALIVLNRTKSEVYQFIIFNLQIFMNFKSVQIKEIKLSKLSQHR